ncbi:hypothetical protein EDB83DRAFT_2345128 [Lactarius deliciosus]|nr:hypothetical protein EDB83DRAFT_2345128 [Lactarius deliciosus]
MTLYSVSRTSPTESSTTISSMALLLHPRDDDDDHDDVDTGCYGGHPVNGAGALTLGDRTIHHPAARTPDRDDDDDTGRDRGHSAPGRTPDDNNDTGTEGSLHQHQHLARGSLSFAPSMTTSMRRRANPLQLPQPCGPTRTAAAATKGIATLCSCPEPR